MNIIYEKYLNEDKESIWLELMNLNKAKYKDDLYIEAINAITNDACISIRNNVELINKSLLEFGYCFDDFGVPNYYNKMGFLPSYLNSKVKIEEMEKFFSPYGKLPFIFTKIYEQIDFIDFRGYFPGWENSFLLDALCLDPIESIIEGGIFNEYNTDNQKDKNFVIFSLDEFFKENISGDLGYGVYLSDEKVADSKLAHFSKDIYFLDYLRLCVKWCGFPSMDLVEEEEIPKSILEFIKDVRKLMVTF